MKISDLRDSTSTSRGRVETSRSQKQRSEDPFQEKNYEYSGLRKLKVFHDEYYHSDVPHKDTKPIQSWVIGVGNTKQWSMTQERMDMLCTVDFTFPEKGLQSKDD